MGLADLQRLRVHNAGIDDAQLIPAKVQPLQREHHLQRVVQYQFPVIKCYSSHTLNLPSRWCSVLPLRLMQRA